MTPGEKLAHQAIEKLPDTIRVGPFTYTLVKWNQNTSVGYRVYGEHSALELQIRLSRGMAAPTKLVDTFIHEISHAIFWVYGVGKDDDEERIVAQFGTAWVALYLDNPWLAPWIQEALHSKVKR